MSRGVAVSWLESDGGDHFFCSGGLSETVTAVRPPGRPAAERAGEEGSHDKPQGGTARRVAQGTKEAPG